MKVGLDTPEHVKSCCDMVAALPKENADERSGNFGCESPCRYTRAYEEWIDDMVAALPKENADERLTLWR